MGAKMTDWPKYRSHKVIQAMPITGITGDGVLLVGHNHEPFHPTVPEMVAKAEVGGYAILYPDGYKSVSPKQSFEDGYTRLGV